jgi:C1A family cysteine protease
MNEHGLSYGTKQEFEFRFNLFKQADQEINEINASQNDYVLGHNKFSTMTEDESKRYRGRKPALNTTENQVELPEEGLSASVDWRAKGAVNKVQDQGQCGSCWAFSSVAALEGEHFLKTGKLIKLSESQLVDCDPKSSGCNGGLEIYAFQYTKKNGEELESDYPYRARTQRCKAKSSLEKVEALSYY